MMPGTTIFIEPSVVQELDQRAAKDQSRSAFTAIGGAKTIVAVVEEFYTRLLRDRQTAPFFEPLVQSDGMSTLKRHQALTLVAALGGPSRYTGRDLYTAHHGLGITHDAYRRVCLHLLTTLHDFRVPMDILVDVDLLLRGLQNLVVTTSEEAKPDEGKPDEVKPDDTTPKDAGEETGQT